MGLIGPENIFILEFKVDMRNESALITDSFLLCQKGTRYNLASTCNRRLDNYP